MVNIMNELAASQHSRVTSLKDRRFRLATVGIFAAIVLLIRIAPSQGAFPEGTNPTISDSTGNTAGGSYALPLNLFDGPGSPLPYPSLSTAFGEEALQKDGTHCFGGIGGCGDGNTAMGFEALNHNTDGNDNTAVGLSALRDNNGSRNTATGVGALYSNLGGPDSEGADDNTATGYAALFSNTTGSSNTAVGEYALFSNDIGLFNTAVGTAALYSDTSGNANTSLGRNSLFMNNLGSANTATGLGALRNNTNGNNNAAVGAYALFGNTTGSQNVAVGLEALTNATTGANNIGVGVNAGKNVVRGSRNIEIGAFGNTEESDTIRIGTNGTQKATYIAGISATGVTGGDVVVSSSGQLGVVLSSTRYKRNIRDMGDASGGLMNLRPVTFRYKYDRSGTLQYGLVAEEVRRVYPDLVTYGPDGKVQSVRYLQLSAMLLNELQKQKRANGELSRENWELRSDVAQVRAEQTRERIAFDRRLSSLEQAMRATMPEVRLSGVIFQSEMRAKSATTK